MNNSLRTRTVVLVLSIIAVILVSICGFGLIESVLNKTEADAIYSGTDAAEGNSAGRIFYQSSWYEPNSNIETVLVLGIDRFSDSIQGDTESQQADFLSLLLLDKEAKSFQLVHLNRDTMTDIPIKNIDGTEIGTKYAQLALAHTYGGNEHSRCRNTMNAVSRLLYGTDVDHYISLTMDAVALLNDSLGGVKIHIEDDLTAVDSAFRKGETIILSGEQALLFVRARGGLEDSSNLSRMERQRKYIGALFEKFTSSGISGENSSEVLLRVGEKMASDLTVEQLTSLEETLRNYTYAGIRTLAGEAVKGKEYMEYYIDETAAQATVIELFYSLCD